MAIQEEEHFCFERLRLEHIPFVLHCEAEAYPEPWTYNMLRQELDNRNGYFCVLFRGKNVTGYGGFWMLVEEAHITRVTVVHSMRGRGLSKMIMNHLLEEAVARDARVVRLEVRENNAPAISLYRGLGFVEEGRRAAYYQRTNENAICMVKYLGTADAKLNNV